MTGAPALALVLAAAAAQTLAPEAHAAEAPDLGRHFVAAGVEGCFLLEDAEGEPLARVHPERAATRVTPASTFKILNSLIILETGVLADKNQVIAWDGVKRWIPEWNRDHTLASAFAVSAVWFYQEAARRVGLERMASWVAKAGYGNGEIGDQVDTFWLEGPLRISPEEQIDFLRRLHRGDLPFSERSMRIVRQIMEAERTETYTVRAKTGWAMRQSVNTGWYVGWVERKEGPRFFALSIEASGRDFPMFRVRREILRGILSDLGLALPAPPEGSRL